MKSKLNRRFQRSRRSKFQLHPTIAKPRVPSPPEDCFCCGEGIFVMKTDIRRGNGRIRVLHQYEQCTVCKVSVISSRRRYMDHSVRASSKVSASLAKRGGISRPKRKYRKCEFSTRQWIKRCDRIDGHWPMGEVQAYYQR